MIDGVIREAIEEAIRFLAKGSVYRFLINEHDVSIVRLSDGGARYLIVCHTCAALVADDVEGRRVHVRIHQHTEIPE